MSRTDGNKTVSQVSVGTAVGGTVVVADSDSRESAFFQVAAGTIWLGAGTAVGSAHGLTLGSGGTFHDAYSKDAWYARGVGGTATLNIVVTE